MFILLLVHVILLLLLKFTAWPEMLAWPYLIIEGYLPYRDIAIAHTPLLLIDLTIFYKIAGIGIWQLKIYTWILVIATDILVFLIAKKLWNIKVATVSLIFYILFFILFDGNGLWFDTGVTFLGLLTFYFLQEKKWKWAGVIFGLGLFTKQTFAWFMIPIGIMIYDLRFKIYEFFKGFIFTLFIFAISLISFGILDDFYFWAIKFGIFSLPVASGQIQFPSIRNLMVALFPFAILLLKPNFKLLPWIIAGVMGAVPRFELFHFQPALPFLALASGQILIGFNKTKRFNKLLISLYIIGLAYLFTNYFIRNYKEGTRFYEPQVIEVVNYIKNNTRPDDRILVLNYWDSIYALSDRLPASLPLVPQLSWYMDSSGIQEKVVADILINKPKIIVLNPYTLTGLSSYKPRLLYDYVSKNYKLEETLGSLEILTQK